MTVFLSLVFVITLIAHFALRWDVRQVPRRDRENAYKRLGIRAKLLSKAFLKLAEAVNKANNSTDGFAKILNGSYKPYVKASTGTHYRRRPLNE
jgi:hypothetical protein